MRFVHFADLHLDTPFTRLPPLAARTRRQALRQTLEAIIEVARRERADAITCGGDLFEADRVSPDTLAWLRDRLGAAGCPVYVAPGNHDWVGPRTAWLTHDWPANVHVFLEARLAPLELAPGLVLWGAGHDRPRGTADLLQSLIRRPADSGALNLALFHGSERASFPIQGRDKEAHAPFDAADLPRTGLAHALLGHFHVPADGPHHTYPGNPDPLQFGETGRRAALVVDVTPAGLTRRRVPVARSQVQEVSVSLDAAAHRDEALTRIRAATTGLSGAVRLELHGEVAAELDLDLACDLTPEALGLLDSSDRAVVVDTTRLTWGLDRDVLRREASVRGELVRRLEAADLPDQERQRVLHVGLRALAGRDDLEVV
ncbi:MAG: DNA repair exonuclease [Myxococcota bacterium]